MPPVYVAPQPPWWGFGWGFGYAPLVPWVWWPAPPPGAAPPEAPPPPDRVISTIVVTGMSGGGTGGSLAFAAEAQRGGFRFSVDGFSPDRLNGVERLPGTDGLAYGTAEVTWSFLAEKTHRLRVELGGSMLAMPSDGSYAGSSYAGTTAFGLLLGLSGQVGLLGPLGLEGHARVTPYPVLITDAALALAVRAGPLAVTGGWRLLDVSGTSGHGPDARLSGPELGLAMVF